MIRNGKVRLAVALTAMLSALSLVPAAQAQDLSQIKKPGDKGDYPVHVGKRVRLASEVYRERQEVARKAAEAASRVGQTSLIPVQMGRQIVAVPTSQSQQVATRKSETSVATSSELPVKQKAKGYFVQRGRATVWVPLPQ